MNKILVIFFLSIQSSYRRNRETPATEKRFDTIQFYASGSKAWRIKTYATDQDVHVWALDKKPRNFIALAVENTKKHYGDVLAEGYIIETTDGLRGVRRALNKRGLPDNLERAGAGFAFWAPPGTKYRTKSTPKEAEA